MRDKVKGREQTGLLKGLELRSRPQRAVVTSALQVPPAEDALAHGATRLDTAAYDE